MGDWDGVNRRKRYPRECAAKDTYVTCGVIRQKSQFPGWQCNRMPCCLDRASKSRCRTGPDERRREDRSLVCRADLSNVSRCKFRRTASPPCRREKTT